MDETEEFPFCCRRILKGGGYAIVLGDHFMVAHRISSLNKAGFIVV